MKRTGERSSLETKRKYLLEIVWWVITALVTLLVILPIIQNSNDYPFIFSNTLFIVVFITLVRYIFFLKYTLIATRQYVKLTLIFLCIPLVFTLVSHLNHFITYIDENSAESFLKEMPEIKATRIGNYLKTEMLLFGVGSIISGAVFPFRLLRSIWKYRNRGVV